MPDPFHLEHHGDHGSAAGGKPKKKGDRQHRDSMVIIIVGVAGVILTFLIYRSNKAKQAAASSGITSASIGSGTGTVLSPGGSANPGAGGAQAGLTAEDWKQLWAGLDQGFGDLYNQESTHYDLLQNQLNSQQAAQQSALEGFGAYLDQLTANLSDVNRAAPPTAAPTLPTYTTQPIMPTAPISSPAAPGAIAQVINSITGRVAVSGTGGQAAIGAGQLWSTPGITNVGGTPYYQGHALTSWAQPGVGQVFFDPTAPAAPGNPHYN